MIESSSEQIDETVDALLEHNSSNIDSPLTQASYDKLIEHYKLQSEKIKIYCEVGWQMIIPDREGIEQHKKHVGFRLDIGIYSPKQKRFVLRIEMDGAMYHKGYKRAFCDGQRQEILEQKGGKSIAFGLLIGLMMLMENLINSYLK